MCAHFLRVTQQYEYFLGGNRQPSEPILLLLHIVIILYIYIYILSHYTFSSTSLSVVVSCNILSFHIIGETIDKTRKRAALSNILFKISSFHLYDIFFLCFFFWLIPLFFCKNIYIFTYCSWVTTTCLKSILFFTPILVACKKD